MRTRQRLQRRKPSADQSSVLSHQLSVPKTEIPEPKADQAPSSEAPGHDFGTIDIVPAAEFAPPEPDGTSLQRQTHALIQPSQPRWWDSPSLPLQRQEDLGQQIRAAQGGGRGLESGVQRSLEAGLGADPSSSTGMHLLAHEAVHTIQQSRGPVAGTPHPGGVSISDPSDRFERAASEMAAGVTEGLTVQPARMQRGAGEESALSIQRMPTSAEVKEQVGPRAAATGPQNQRTHYQEVLAALDRYQLIVTQNVATSPSERSRQVTDIRKALITVIDTCDRCLGVASSSAIAERCKGLKREAQQEEQLLGGRKNYFAQNPSAQKGTWKDALSDAASKYGVLAAGLAGELKRQAAAVEPGITDQIRTTVAQHGGQMYGLQHRLKEEESLARKIHEEAPGKGLTEEAYASRIKDAVRYTAHFSTATYTQGVESTMAALQSSGNRLYDLKNTWPLGYSYRGLNTWWKNRNGTIFEVQFHTPESQAVKDRNHKIYDVARLAQTTPQQRLAMEQEMITNANSIPTPPGAPSISGPISP